MLILALPVGFLMGWISNQNKTICVADIEEPVSRPVRVTETIYSLPMLNCPSPSIESNVSGYTMSELIIWGQNAYNWIANCHGSLIDAMEEVSKKNTDITK